MAQRTKNTPPKKGLSIEIDAPSDLGAALRQLRMEKGISQAQAAGLCNVGTRFISDLENGKATVQLGLTLKVMNAFGFTLNLKKRRLLNDE
jgi:HTH-type transcriptional regulator / antitoxin HipB